VVDDAPCTMAKYCSRECQVGHQAVHRVLCKRYAAACATHAASFNAIAAGVAARDEAAASGYDACAAGYADTIAETREGMVTIAALVAETRDAIVAANAKGHHNRGVCGGGSAKLAAKLAAAEIAYNAADADADAATRVKFVFRPQVRLTTP